MEKNHIIVVDDAPETTDLLKEILAGAGYVVLIAHNGKTALELINRTLPMIVLLDVMMPEMDGYEVLERIKSEPSTENIDVIMVTAKGLEDDIQRGLDLGVCDYMSKPFYPELLLKRIQRVLKNKSNLNNN